MNLLAFDLQTQVWCIRLKSKQMIQCIKENESNFTRSRQVGFPLSQTSSVSLDSTAQS